MTLQWVHLPLFGTIRATSLIAGALILGVVLWRTRSFGRAVITVLGWASLYEVIDIVTYAAVHRFSLSTVAWQAAALIGWIWLASAKGIFPEWRLSIAFAILWIAWISTGFAYNGHDQQRNLDYIGESFNVLTKSSLALAYVVGAVRPIDQQSLPSPHRLFSTIWSLLHTLPSPFPSGQLSKRRIPGE